MQLREFASFSPQALLTHTGSTSRQQVVAGVSPLCEIQIFCHRMSPLYPISATPKSRWLRMPYSGAHIVSSTCCISANVELAKPEAVTCGSENGLFYY